MKSMHYILLLPVFSLPLVTSPTLADCKSSKQDAAQKVELISTQMRGANICKSNKLNIKALEVNIEYLKACPDVDPDGNKREEILISIKNAQKAKKATCS